jgi:hypothetical protein
MSTIRTIPAALATAVGLLLGACVQNPAPAGDFSLSTGAIQAAGGEIRIPVTVSKAGGFAGEVALSAAGDFPGLEGGAWSAGSVSFADGAASRESVLTLSTAGVPARDSLNLL